nr:MAG TPA: hypothetical protein [Caudoviricetes sp.]
MGYQHKIDKANHLLDVIEAKQGDKKLKELSSEDLIYMIRCYEIFVNMVVDLIISGAWDK